jgi:hypothetical protein
MVNDCNDKLLMATPDVLPRAHVTFTGAPIRRDSPVSLNVPLPSMASRRSMPLLVDVTSTEPSSRTSTGSQSDRAGRC